MPRLHFNSLIPLKRDIAINVLPIVRFIGLKNLKPSPAVYGWAAGAWQIFKIGLRLGGAGFNFAILSFTAGQ